MKTLDALLKIGSSKKIGSSAIPECLPFSIDPPGATEAVLLLHGFTGNPAELRAIGNALAEAGYAVHAPRYPGHGSNRADFLGTKAADWVRRAFDARMELGAKYKTVHVAGHSMGGVIASVVASAFETPRLILLAPAFVLGIKGTKLTPFIAPFKKVGIQNRPPSPADKDHPVRSVLHREYWMDDMIGPSAELLELSKKARKNLERIESKVLAILGSNDATVPLPVQDVLKDKLISAASLDIKVIEGAGHLFPFDESAAETASIAVKWLKS